MQVDIATEADLSVMGTGPRVNPAVRPDVRTLTDIPIESLGFFAGTDLASTVKSILDDLRNNQDADVDVDAQIEEFEQQAGVSLEDDILPLLSGDYVFSISLDDRSGSTQPSAIFQIKLKDSGKAQQVLDRLAYQASGGDAEKIDLAGGTFYAPEPGEGVLIGVAQNRFWLVYDADVDSATARIDQTVAELGKGLGTTAAWRDTAMHLPRDSNTIAYVDLKALREYFERETDTASSETYDKDIAPFLKPIKYLLVGSAEHGTSSVGSRSRNHTVVFVGINGQ
jgi:hypothetical protein